MFVNHLSKEIVIGLVYLCGDGAQAHKVASYLQAKVGQGDVTTSEPGGVHRETFDFVPQGLGKIRGFDVRVVVSAIAYQPSAHAELAVMGADLLAVVGDDDPQARSRAAFGTAALAKLGQARVPLVLLAGAGVTERTALELTAASQVLRAADSLEEQLFPSLKLGLKVALEEMKKPQPEPSEPLQPVAVVPIVDLLRLAEQKKKAPLTEAEVLRVRDGAPFVMIAVSKARHLDDVRGYTDLDPEHLWEAWQRVRRSAPAR